MEQEQQYAITKEECQEIAEEKLCDYLTAKAGQRLVSDFEDPKKAYIQEQNTYSQAGEVFSMNCPGIGDGDWSYLREGWNCEHLSDEEVIEECCEKGDMSDDINILAENIWNSVKEFQMSHTEKLTQMFRESDKKMAQKYESPRTSRGTIVIYKNDVVVEKIN